MKDKVVIITGSGSGIGAATAKLFAEKGAHVIVSDINDQNANQVVAEIKNAGHNATSIFADVSKFESIQNLIKKTLEIHDRIDVMVNNAGIGNTKFLRTAEHTLDDWDKVIAVNQTGVFYCMKLALAQMMKQGYGNIVNVASLAGLKASTKNIAYAASKFAVVGMTKSAAMEYGSKNIRINAVCPSYTKSALLNQLIGFHPDMEEKLLKFVPMRRFGEPEEIADAILWLASDESKFITGQTLTLDGGLSL